MAQTIPLIASLGSHSSPARTRDPAREPFRIAAVQERWHADPGEHEEALAAGIRRAAQEGAQLVCLQELTLCRYFAVDPAGPEQAGAEPEQLPGGRTFQFAERMARETGVYVHASLYERADAADGLGFNTAIVVAPDGALAARTRKLHIPVTAGYYEDRYFRPGPGEGDPYPLVKLAGALSSACPPAGTSGSRRSLAPTRCAGRRCRSSTRRRSAPSPITPSSTPSRCGSR